MTTRFEADVDFRGDVSIEGDLQMGGSLVATGYRDMVADAAIEIGPNDRTILLSLVANESPIEITTATGVFDGQWVLLHCKARTAGSYTLALGGSQTLTIDAAAERALIARVDGAWRHLSLVGATVSG